MIQSGRLRGGSKAPAAAAVVSTNSTQQCTSCREEEKESRRVEGADLQAAGTEDVLYRETDREAARWAPACFHLFLIVFKILQVKLTLWTSSVTNRTNTRHQAHFQNLKLRPWSAACVKQPCDIWNVLEDYWGNSSTTDAPSAALQRLYWICENTDGWLLIILTVSLRDQWRSVRDICRVMGVKTVLYVAFRREFELHSERSVHTFDLLITMKKHITMFFWIDLMRFNVCVN